MASVTRIGAVVRVALDRDEAGVLSGLAGQVREMLAPPPATEPADPLEEIVGLATTPVPPPDDAAVRRLLPDAYSEPDAAGEFRRLTDADLRAAKCDALDRLVDDIGAGPAQVDLGADDADAWLRALNDVRLVVGNRLDVTEETAEREIDPDDPRLPLFVVYDWLTALQDRMVDAVMGSE